MPAVDDFKSFNKFDQAVLGLGALGFIVSFFPFYGVSYGGGGLLGGASYSVNAWHSFGFLGMLLFLAATALAAMRLFAAASLPKMPIGINLLTFGLSALERYWSSSAASPTSTPAGRVSASASSGAALLSIVMIAQAVAAFMLFKSSGEAMPDFQAMQANRTAGAVPPPPGQGMTPPAATYPPATPAGDFTLDDTKPPTP